jgi:phosphoglycolate phosphatase
MSRLIVFDCDGTLVDSQQLIVEAARQTLLAHDLEPLEASAVRAVIGLSLDLALAQLVPGVDERMLISLVATYRARWRLLRTQGVLEPLFPRAREVLGMLDQGGHLLGIATGKSRAGVLEVLDTTG